VTFSGNNIVGLLGYFGDFLAQKFVHRIDKHRPIGDKCVSVCSLMFSSVIWSCVIYWETPNFGVSLSC